MVRTLKIVEKLPTYFLCSKSDPLVVAKRASLKQYANRFFAN